LVQKLRAALVRGVTRGRAEEALPHPAVLGPGLEHHLAVLALPSLAPRSLLVGRTTIPGVSTLTATVRAARGHLRAREAADTTDLLHHGLELVRPVLQNVLNGVQIGKTADQPRSIVTRAELDRQAPLDLAVLGVHGRLHSHRGLLSLVSGLGGLVRLGLDGERVDLLATSRRHLSFPLYFTGQPETHASSTPSATCCCHTSYSS